MRDDVALGRLLALDMDGLTDLLAPEVEAARRDARIAEVRFGAYLGDLAQVLSLPDGAGVRVLRHWLDCAGAEQRLSQAGVALRAAAALHDYARDRMAEVALADPVSLVRIQLEGARQWAATRLELPDGQIGQQTGDVLSDAAATSDATGTGNGADRGNATLQRDAMTHNREE